MTKYYGTFHIVSPIKLLVKCPRPPAPRPVSTPCTYLYAATGTPPIAARARCAAAADPWMVNPQVYQYQEHTVSCHVMAMQPASLHYATLSTS